MVGKTAREYPKTEELREAAKAAFRWQGTCYGAFTLDHAVTATQKTILKAFDMDANVIKYQAQEISRILKGKK